MRLDYCPFTDQNGESVFINPLQVRCIRPLSSGSRIEFEKGHYVAITAKPSEAAESLKLDER